MNSGLLSALTAPTEVQLPPAHLGLSWRTPARADRAQMTRLLVTGQLADDPVRPEPITTVYTLLEDLAAGRADAVAGFDEAGTLRALGQVRTVPVEAGRARAEISATVSPCWRGRGIGRELIGWQDQRARQLLAEQIKEHDDVTSAVVAVFVDEHQVDRRRLYAAAGFAPARTYVRLSRSLEQPVPVEPTPTGLRLVAWDDVALERIEAAHRVAFGTPGVPDRNYTSLWQRAIRTVEPSLSRVAVCEESGEVAGYILQSLLPWTWHALGRPECFTSLLGVMPDFRHLGTARALLTAGLTEAARQGFVQAALNADTENLTGATSFYERLGYVTERRRSLYLLDLTQ
ncbi:GNAT family N-acetyltransferase [Buchananella felis]|uniref:GNAT family N-acetyltransferase n=1 Tax=Buchananella felis TaxID=3231492 RepID=UPI003529A349